MFSFESTSSGQSFLLAMAFNPDVQRRAQKELDAVIGTQRLPEPSDLRHLVYMQAIMLEVSRWAPVVPLGVFHRVIEDDEYNGFFIPKGAVIIPVSINPGIQPLAFNVKKFSL